MVFVQGYTSVANRLPFQEKSTCGLKSGTSALVNVEKYFKDAGFTQNEKLKVMCFHSWNKKTFSRPAETLSASVILREPAKRQLQEIIVACSLAHFPGNYTVLNSDVQS